MKRIFPAEGDGYNYAPFVQAVKKAGYDGRMSIEANCINFEAEAAEGLKMMKKLLSEGKMRHEYSNLKIFAQGGDAIKGAEILRGEIESRTGAMPQMTDSEKRTYLLSPTRTVCATDIK